MIAGLSRSEAEASLSRIVEEVFAAMTGISVVPNRQVIEPAAVGCGASVSYLGLLPCTVAIVCSRRLADTVTRRLMASSCDHSWEADVQDTVGELANMIGGNFKALLPEGTLLTPPLAFEGWEIPRQTPFAPAPLTLQFAADEGSCQVGLYMHPETS